MDFDSKRRKEDARISDQQDRGEIEKLTENTSHLKKKNS